MKSPHKILCAAIYMLLGWTFNGTAQNVQYVMLETTNNTSVQYPLQTNQIISVVGVYGNATTLGSRPDGKNIVLPQPSSGPFQIFTGLTNATLSAGNTLLCVTLQITTPASADVVTNSYIPANAVVIPSSATGNVEIILESSTDLVNWTAASPGIYGASSATNRFFRVRAVHN